MNNFRSEKKWLENDSNTISASEINRYTYCPYQWYYERVYGRKELRRLVAERNRKLGLSNSQSSHFSKGLHYHEKEYQKYRRKRWLKKAVIVLLLGILCYCVIRMQIGA
ncbi:MAG: PD-(D/E)XK nuclease family protein [Epulopiscium sp.]|jgi:hypothetical protein|nr:PD-(D/E)XK nuclease family protein [Candidatus Epulonipiscium sp.]